jgi:rod shape determining protein RodA
MGDPEETGRQLDQAHRPRTAWGAIAAVGALLAFSLAAMQLASVADGVNWLTGQVRWILVGLAVAVPLYLGDYRWLKRLAWPVYAGTLAWGLQPALLASPWAYWEPAPYLLTVATAGIVAGYNWDRRFAVAELALLCGAPLLFYLVRSDALYLPLHAMVVVALLLTARAPRHLLARLAGIAAPPGALLLWYIMQAPHRVERLKAWLLPWSDAHGGGYVQIQSRIALWEAGWLGHGLSGEASVLPEIHSEMVFPFLVHTLGWVAGVALLALSGYLLVRLWGLVRQVREPFGRVLAAGLLTVLVVQFVWNLSMVFGFAPLTSLPLPFVTFGRSVTVQVAATGLLLGVYRRKDLIAAAHG